MKRHCLKWAVVGVCVFCSTRPALAWFDKTHLAVAKVGGYEMWFNAAAPDLAKEKAWDVEGRNHYYNPPSQQETTPAMVLDQATLYNSATDTQGHLLGAIIGALRKYQELLAKGKFAEYHMAYASHYIGDLSMPFHQMGWDEFNQQHHATNDGIVDASVLDHLDRISCHMYQIEITSDQAQFESDLAKEVARIANLSRKLGNQLREEKRDMTQEEAYVQLGHSASLMKAVLGCLKK